MRRDPVLERRKWTYLRACRDITEVTNVLDKYPTLLPAITQRGYGYDLELGDAYYQDKSSEWVDGFIEGLELAAQIVRLSKHGNANALAIAQEMVEEWERFDEDNKAGRLKDIRHLAEQFRDATRGEQ